MGGNEGKNTCTASTNDASVRGSHFLFSTRCRCHISTTVECSSFMHDSSSCHRASCTRTAPLPAAPFAPACTHACMISKYASKCATVDHGNTRALSISSGPALRAWRLPMLCYEFMHNAGMALSAPIKCTIDLYTFN